MIQRFLEALFPTNVECHCCERGLIAGQDRYLCAYCLHNAQKLRIPKEDLFRALSSMPNCIAAYRFKEVPRKMIHLLKYGSDGDMAVLLGEAMSDALAQSGIDRDGLLVVAVPMHPNRERKRGYNQAALLAQQVAFHTGLPLEQQAVQRVRHSASQLTRNRAQRLSAIQNAFRAQPDVVQGRRILLIDDVITTGATAEACGYALLQAGATEVILLTAARA